MCKKAAKKRTVSREAPSPLNFITINGMTLSLGDLRKADFDAIPNPKASVKSIQDTLIAMLNVLRGHSETGNA